MLKIYYQELKKSGYAWPDPWLLPSEDTTKGVKQNWKDIYVNKVVDGSCFWASVEVNPQERLLTMSNDIEQYVYSSDVCPLAKVKNGDRICLSLAR